jgi:hypothetical protein
MATRGWLIALAARPERAPGRRRGWLPLAHEKRASRPPIRAKGSLGEVVKAPLPLGEQDPFEANSYWLSRLLEAEAGGSHAREPLRAFARSVRSGAVQRAVSSYRHGETVTRLLDAIAQRGLMVLAQIDHAAAAREAGMDLPN